MAAVSRSRHEGRGGQARNEAGQGLRPREHDIQPQESQQQQFVAQPIHYHGTAPSHRWCNEGIILDLQVMELSAG
jgi:hypothetical protein